MSRTYVRNLTFQTNDLGKETTLLLTFDNGMHGIYKDHFPVVWRAVTFGESGSYSMRATYTSQLAFSTPQIDNGNIVGASTCVQIKDQERTILTEAHDVLHFSDPQPRNGQLVAVNETSGIQGEMNDVAPGDGCMEPVRETSGIDGSGVKATFTPILRAYISSDYQEGQILQAVIETDQIWEQNLSSLHQSTTWNLKRNPASGQYTITQAPV